MAKKWLNGLDERLQYEKDDTALKSVLPNIKQCVSVKWNDKPGEYKAYYLGNNLWRIEITPPVQIVGMFHQFNDTTVSTGAITSWHY